jgi:hypothetical protein
MAFGRVLARFVERCPVTVMVRVLFERVLSSEAIDAIFEEHRGRQYRRELLFSTVVQVMTLVAVGMRPSVHAAAKSLGDFGASLSALYQKLNGTSITVVRALVRETAVGLLGIRSQLGGAGVPLARGLRVLVIDGSHLPASEKRLAVLRGRRGAALPGQALVLYAPEDDTVLDVVPGEDAHASERALLGALVPRMMPGELYLADRLFGVWTAMFAVLGQGASFVFRARLDSVRMKPLAERRCVGRTETGTVYEQPVRVYGDDGSHDIRRVDVDLEQQAQDGSRTVVLLTNVASDTLDGKEIAMLYLKRWTIENMFQRLESALQSEIPALSHPRAALFAFGTAVVAYNVLSTLQHAIVVEKKLSETGPKLSTYHLAIEVRATYDGMAIAVEERAWTKYATMDDRQVASVLLEIAHAVRIQQFVKAERGPKPEKKLGYVSRDVATRHVATARVLRAKKGKTTP